MKTNNTETKTTNVIPAIKQQTGFYTNLMPILSKSGEHVLFFLPGEIVVTEHVNRFKGLLGIEYTPKAPSQEKREYAVRTGLQAKVRMGLSPDGQWVTLYLPGNMGKVSNHVNAYKHIFKIPYEKKTKAA